MALALLCLLSVACGPPPPGRRGTATAPAATYARPTPTAGVRTPTPGPTAASTAVIPTENAIVSTTRELRVALRENINTLNPYLATTVSESFVASLLYDTLADEDARGNLIPNLAQRWELSTNGTKLTCWLNPQARWHNGQPVTAGDVVFSFDLVRRTAFPGLARVAALVAGAEALGSTQVEFTLLRPGSETVRQICSRVPIVPAASWDLVEDPLTHANLDRPIGSGPFALLEYAAPADAGSSTAGRWVLRNTGMHHSTRPIPKGGYGRGAPSMDKLVVEIIRDESKALQTLQEGGFDLLGWDITRTMARDVLDHPENYPGIQVAATAGVSTHSLLFNLRQAPYDNAALRTALAQAVDTQVIVDEVWLGFADRGTVGLFPPASPWYDQSIPAVPFDTQQAVEKLAQVGFVDRDGDGLRESPDGSTLQITITCAKADAALRVVERVVASWRAVGIKARVSAVPAEQIRPLLMQAQFEVALYELSLHEPEEAYFYFHSSRGLLIDGQVPGYNYGGYASPEYDRISEMVQDAPQQDSGQRLELLRLLQGILAADLPQIPLYSPQLLHLYRDSQFYGWSPEPGLGLLSRTAIANLRAR